MAAYRFIAKGHVTVLVCEIPCQTLLTAIIRPKECYILAHPKTFAYCKLGVAELKLERSPVPFILAS